ncbi:MAG: hypothetical protein IPJ28_15075 [Betaproteobacteria bacterium]|nr:hypothetical protein [Betaproteobacteria bacterium]
MRNLIDEPQCRGPAVKLEGQMQALVARIGDRFLPKEDYYRQFGIELDHRGKVKGIIENLYDRPRLTGPFSTAPEESAMTQRFRSIACRAPMLAAALAAPTASPRAIPASRSA